MMQHQNQQRNWLLWLLPTPGNIIFTLLVVSGLLWTQNIGAISLEIKNAPSTTTTLPYQGRLTDANGNPVSASQSMTFQLYSEASGGTALWTENRSGENSVTVTDGLFNVMLGNVTSLDQSIITTNSTLYLGVSIGSNPEISPRVQLARIPFAVHALQATQASLADTVSDGSITTAKLANGAVTQTALADESVAQTALASSAVTEPKLADGAVSSAKLANDAVTSAKLADNAVTQTALADGSVAQAALANSAVTESKLADSAVTSTKIVDGSVTEAKLADSAVTQTKLADGIVTSAKIVDGAVTEAKLSSSLNLAMIKMGQAHEPASEWSLASGAGTRRYTETVTFDSPFSSIPEISVNLRSVDVYDGTNVRLSVYAESITTTGFVIGFVTWADTRIATATAGWIAVTSP
ncbi:MAG: H-type lectin domain-containing protein [Chloroflexota bacterium]